MTSERPTPADAQPGTTPSQKRGFSEWLSLYGPLLLALYFVMTTRWGSYLLPGPPYIGDIALAALIANRLWGIARREAPQPVLGRAMTLTTIALIAYSIVRLALGEHSVDAIRDAAPYLYGVLVLFGQSYRSLPRANVEGLIYGALILHVTWYSVAEFIPSAITVATPGDSTVLLFGGRADIDGACLGILCALGLDRTILGRTPILSAIAGGWALTLVLLTQSRASFLAALAAIGFIALRQLLVWRKAQRRATETDDRPAADGGGRRSSAPLSLALVATMLLGVPLAVTVLSGTPAPLSRSLNAVSLVDGSQPSSKPARSSPSGGGTGAGQKPGDGKPTGGGGGGQSRPADQKPSNSQAGDTGFATAAARTAGWRAVIDWMPEGGPSRVALGVGFGPSYLKQSGADIVFLGPTPDPTVRAVHNFGLNTWARLGLLGLIPLALIVALSLVAAVRLSTLTAAPSDLDLFASLLVLVIPVVAFLGVVFESPFGAIPYFWAVGYLSARMVEEGLWKPFKLPPRLAGVP